MPLVAKPLTNATPPHSFSSQQWSTPYPTTTPLSPAYGPLPLDLGMDLDLAATLLRAAGFNAPFEAVDVKWPVSLAPLAMQQPYYFFELEGEGEGAPGGGGAVAVGVRDGSVRRVGGGRGGG